MSGDIQSLLELLNHNDVTAEDVNIQDEDQTSPFHLAAHFGHVEATEILLQAGGDCSSWDASGNTPIHAAIENNHLNVLKVLLEKNNDSGVICDIIQVSSSSQLPLELSLIHI